MNVTNKLLYFKNKNIKHLIFLIIFKPTNKFKLFKLKSILISIYNSRITVFHVIIAPPFALKPGGAITICN